jgi:flagellar hook-basal body complex protein FliE
MAVNPISSISALANVASAASVGPAAGVGSLGSSVGGVAPTGLTQIGGATSPASDPATSGQSFIDSLGNELGQLNTQLTTTDAAMADFAAGGSSDLHTVMLQMQEASIGVKVATQVRDRLLEAYQEIMRIQL